MACWKWRRFWRCRALRSLRCQSRDTSFAFQKSDSVGVDAWVQKEFLGGDGFVMRVENRESRGENWELKASFLLKKP